MTNAHGMCLDVENTHTLTLVTKKFRNQYNGIAASVKTFKVVRRIKLIRSKT